MRVAIYTRVSTSGQEASNQLRELEEYCGRRKWQVVQVYSDVFTGKTGNREAFKRLFQDAERHRFEMVLVWALDRFSRQGIFETLQLLERLTNAGVQFESFTEPHFRTIGPAGELMMMWAAWAAKQEHERISERTKAGLARAAAEGRVGGRRPKIFRRDEAARLRAEGMSWRKIAKLLNVPCSTVRGAVREYEACAKTPAGKVSGPAPVFTESADVPGESRTIT